MIISIDHGNKQIKTLNRTFTSGLLERDSKPAFGEDILCYEGKYYTLSDKDADELIKTRRRISFSRWRIIILRSLFINDFQPACTDFFKG